MLWDLQAINKESPKVKTDDVLERFPDSWLLVLKAIRSR